MTFLIILALIICVFNVISTLNYVLMYLCIRDEKGHRLKLNHTVMIRGIDSVMFGFYFVMKLLIRNKVYEETDALNEYMFGLLFWCCVVGVIGFIVHIFSNPFDTFEED